MAWRLWPKQLMRGITGHQQRSRPGEPVCWSSVPSCERGILQPALCVEKNWSLPCYVCCYSNCIWKLSVWSLSVWIPSLVSVVGVLTRNWSSMLAVHYSTWWWSLWRNVAVAKHLQLGVQWNKCCLYSLSSDLHKHQHDLPMCFSTNRRE